MATSALEAGDWSEHRRYLWLASLLLPMLPLASLLAWSTWPQAWLLWLTPVTVYGLVPLLDLLCGEDRNNPPESLVPALEEDRWYRWLTWLTVPAVWLTVVATAWVAVRGDLSPLGWLGLAVSAGWTSGAGINVAHELGHKKGRLERWLARFALAPACYGHFVVEHVRGHHRDVATPADPASSRLGESYYRFMMREIPGACRRAWALERERLAGLGHGVFHVGNENLQAWALSAGFWGVLLLALGPLVLPFLLLQAVFAYSLLSAANYVEHYGLLRARGPDGRYERVAPCHSWNSNHVVSNLLLYQLQRHSDHHAWPARRYQSLRHFEDAPQLPTGYFGMFLLALVPPLWRRVMDPRVLAHAGGDLRRVNRLDAAPA
ncbi:MAG TPA: alkane 1-monooxygenase [Gammaproteobacteria bacterium]|nr:alkane 1-monooxygenase [Gammaproteobacteria bacterium]